MKTTSTVNLPQAGSLSDAVVAEAHRAMMPLTRLVRVTHADGTRINLAVTRLGVGPLVTDWGAFHLYAFDVADDWGQYFVLVKAHVDSSFMPIFPTAQQLPLRIDSGCCTGQIFHDLTCDCRMQLQYGMRKMAEAGAGILISIPAQDGRGKGIAFKLSTLRLQLALGWDTVRAAQVLAESTEIDDRDYTGAIAVLRFLGCDLSDFVLITGNPKKERALRLNGFRFVAKPPVVPVTPQTLNHLKAKMAELGHQIPGLDS